MQDLALPSPVSVWPFVTLALVVVAVGAVASLTRALRQAERRLRQFASARDSVHALKRAREGERRYRNLFESLGHLVFLTDAKGTLVHFNGRWESYLGIKPATDGSLRWQRFVHAADIRALARTWSRAVRSRTQFKAQFRLRRFDGSFRWQHAQASPAFDEHGALLQWIGSVTEIEEQHQANERFQSVFRQAPVVMAFFRGPRFQCEQATPLARQLFGENIESGQPLREMLPELEGQGLLEWMEHVYRTGQPFHGTEYPAWLRAGTPGEKIVYINLVLQPTRNAEQRVDGVMLLGADVTELVEARNRLQANETKLRRLVDSNIIGILFFDATRGQVLEANESLLEMTGYTREDLRMGRLSRATLTTPEYEAANERAIGQLLALGKTETYESEFVRRDGTRVPILMAAALLQAGGSEGVAWVFDLSERKRTERELQIHRERLDLVVDSMKVGVWYSDVPFTQLKCNATLREHFYSPPDQEVSLTACYRHLADEDRQRVEASVRRCLLQGVDYDEVYRVHRALPGENTGGKAGEDYRWIRAFGKSYRAANGCVMRFDGVTLDVTRQMLAEQELHRALRSRDEFISVASHELRTPLTSMKLQIQAAKRLLDQEAADTPRALTERTRPVPDRVRQVIYQSDRQILRLTRLIDDMLDISRIHTGRLSIRREPIELGSLIQEVVERLAPQLERAACPTRLQSVEQVWLEADRYRLEQVVTNLLTNACRHGAGHPIELSWQNREGAAYLAVSDHGGGIAAKDHERIFLRYERATPPSEGSGLGIGLFISKQIVQMHGGSIAVQSQPGAGAIFTVSLPAMAKQECANAH